MGSMPDMGRPSTRTTWWIWAHAMPREQLSGQPNPTETPKLPPKIKIPLKIPSKNKGNFPIKEYYNIILEEKGGLVLVRRPRLFDLLHYDFDEVHP